MIIWQDDEKNERIDALTRLVPKKRFAIMTLENLCREYDGTFSEVETEPGYKPDRHFRSFFLYYEGRRLIGELFLFLTDSDSVEITSIVDPCCRKRGVFARLLKTAEEELDKYGVLNRYFVAEPDCKDAMSVAGHLKLVTDHFELIMALSDRTNQTTDSVTNDEKDNNDYTKPGYTVSIEKDGDIYNALIKETSEVKNIGSANACVTGKSVFIYGIGIDENYRRMGFGRKLITELIKRIREDLPENSIKLQVSSSNVPAVELYRSIGFETVSSLAYIKAAVK